MVDTHEVRLHLELTSEHESWQAMTDAESSGREVLGESEVLDVSGSDRDDVVVARSSISLLREAFVGSSNEGIAIGARYRPTDGEPPAEWWLTGWIAPTYSSFTVTIGLSVPHRLQAERIASALSDALRKRGHNPTTDEISTTYYDDAEGTASGGKTGTERVTHTRVTEARGRWQRIGVFLANHLAAFLITVGGTVLATAIAVAIGLQAGR